MDKNEAKGTWKGLRSIVEQPGYLPLKKAADWAGVSPKTVQRWIGRGLPVYQAGPREKVLVRPVDIDHFLTRKQSPSLNLDEMVNSVLRDIDSK